MGTISSQTPAGVIKAFAGPSTSVPAGWLLCNGSSLLRTSFPELFAAIGTAWGAADGTHFNIPDLRGYFLRGQNLGTGRDPDAGTRTNLLTGGNSTDNVGSYQSHQVTSHTHTHGLNTGGPTGFNGWPNTSVGQGFNTSGPSGPQTNTATQGASFGGNETRPLNANVNYIIKY